MAGRLKGMRASPRRWIVAGLGALLALAALYVAVLAYPAPLFRHHLHAAGIRIHSDRPPTVDAADLAAEVLDRLDAFELEPRTRVYDVYLCHSLRRYGLLTRLARRTPSSQAMGLSAPGNIFVNMPRLAELAAEEGGRFAHSRFEGDLAFAIAHEIAHFGILDHLGMKANRSLPEWKSEGWADFQAGLAEIRRDPDYDLARRIDLLDDPGTWQDPELRARRFYAWQLMVEYLVAKRGYRFEDLRRPAVTESDTWEQLRAWRRLHVKDGEIEGLAISPAGSEEAK